MLRESREPGEAAVLARWVAGCREEFAYWAQPETGTP
ncbi:hypothetical protein ABIA38_006489 [Embleya sp. AB8]